MVKIVRKLHKQFGLNGNATDFGYFGSEAEGLSQTSKDTDNIQSLTAYLTGWSGALIGNKKIITKQDLNSLGYLFSYFLSYILQSGIPEYLSTQTYYIGDYCREDGTSNLYTSLTDDNIGNPLTDPVNWKLVPEVVDATTNVKGIIEIAIQTEVETGTDDTKAISPKSLRDAMANSKITNGYTKLSNGIIIQWGYYTGSLHAPTITFPLAFPNSVFNIVATIETLTSGAMSGWNSLTTTNVVIQQWRHDNVAVANNFTWYAIGY